MLRESVLGSQINILCNKKELHTSSKTQKYNIADKEHLRNGHSSVLRYC